MQPDISASQYQQALSKIHDYIQAGDCYQVNYTQRFSAQCEGDAWSAYCALRLACPTPFSGFMSLPDDNAILSLSPERFVRVSHNQVETRPIKGTRPRGRNSAEDAANAAELLDLCRTHHLSVAALMLANERTWRSEDEIRCGLIKLWRAICSAIH